MRNFIYIEKARQIESERAIQKTGCISPVTFYVFQVRRRVTKIAHATSLTDRIEPS